MYGYVTAHSPRVAHVLDKLTLAQLRRRHARADAICGKLVDDELKSGRAMPYVFAQNSAAGGMFDAFRKYQTEVATAIFYKRH